MSSDAPKPTIAVFDFDGTLIRRNTLTDFFIRMFPFKKSMWYGILLIPSILKYLVGVISNETLKEKMLILYLHGMQKKDFEKLCLFYKERLGFIENKKAINRLLWHKKQDHIIIIISASIEDWILPWAEQYTREVIATRLEEIDDILTGRLSGKNCYGPEKVKRFLEKYPRRFEYNLYVYGDGASDREILKIADCPYKGNFGTL